MKKEKRTGFFNRIWKSIKKIFQEDTNVYFISGMCYNCSVYDGIELPEGYKKIYIEWLIPEPEETLDAYSHRMAATINTKQKFILIGYSLGGVIVQEIARFMKPEKVILISSMKDAEEIPPLFQVAQKVNFANNIPMRLYNRTDFMINLFNKYVYNLPTKALEGFMTVIDPIYIKWALHQITNWVPRQKTEHLYHIHGTKDQVFPYEQIINPITIKGADHLMVIKHAKKISILLETIFADQPKKDEQ